MDLAVSDRFNFCSDVSTFFLWKFFVSNNVIVNVEAYFKYVNSIVSENFYYININLHKK